MPADEFTIRAIGLGVLLPTGASAAVVGLLVRCWPRLAALGGPVALAAGVWAGVFTLDLAPLTPSGPGWEWLPHLAILALPAGWAVARSRRLLVLPVGVITAVVSVAMIVPKWPPLTRENVAWTLALGEMALVLAVVLVRVVPLLPKTAVVAAMILVMTTISLVLFAAGNARFAQTTGVVTAALGGAALVVTFIRQDVAETIVRGLIPGLVPS